jgi:hypothetical protein
MGYEPAAAQGRLPTEDRCHDQSKILDCALMRWRTDAFVEHARGTNLRLVRTKTRIARPGAENTA